VSTKRDYTFKPPRDYNGDWREYFADYATNREQVNNPKVVEVERGTVELVDSTEEVSLADAIRSAKTLAAYAQDLGFAVKVHTSSQRKFWNGVWKEQPVWHVSGKMGLSAFHARWVDGKAVETRVQINGGPVEWLPVTKAKERLVGAESDSTLH
jgi:hypothetical protein